MLSVTHADWTRERRHSGTWEPGKSLFNAIRDYQKARKGSLRAKWAVARHRFWSAVSGADIPLNCKIEGGLLLPHPIGVVVHPDAVIGPNCLFFQQVTIGSNGGVPSIGGHVDIGAGAKLIGPIHIGDHAKIGANAVVLIDVPAGATAVGNPARIVESEKNKIYASTDDEAHAIAVSMFGAATLARWSVYREEGSDRVVVCRHFHVLSGAEIVEYLDQIDVDEVRARETAVAFQPTSGVGRQEAGDDVTGQPSWPLRYRVEAAPAA